MPLEHVAEIIRTDAIVRVCGMGFDPIVLFGADCAPGAPGVPVASDGRPVAPVVPVDGEPVEELPGIVFDILPDESLTMPVIATL